MLLLFNRFRSCNYFRLSVDTMLMKLENSVLLVPIAKFHYHHYHHVSDENVKTRLCESTFSLVCRSRRCRCCLTAIRCLLCTRRPGNRLLLHSILAAPWRMNTYYIYKPAKCSISSSDINPLKPNVIMWLHFECSVP